MENKGITEQELAEIEALAAAATKGPWYGYENQGVFLDEEAHNPVFQTGCGCCTQEDLSEADAAFIAASREAVPRMAAEIRRLREELEGATNGGCNECRYKLQSEAWKYYTYPCSECRRRTKDHFARAEGATENGGAQNG
jgi:hypothetical protein